MGTFKRKHYHIGKKTWGESVRGYVVNHYVRRISPRKQNLINSLRAHRKLFKHRGIRLSGSTLSKKAGHHVSKRMSFPIWRGIRAGSIQQKRATLGRAIVAASRSGSSTVHSGQTRRRITIIPVR